MQQLFRNSKNNPLVNVWTKTNDMWAGAQKACADIGMRLPTKEELITLSNTSKGKNGVPEWGRFWASNDSSTYSAYSVNINDGTANDYHSKNSQKDVICIQK